MSPTPTPPPVPAPHISSLLSPSSLFYLNLPQICPSTKQLPSLFWAIMCGSVARPGPPGRQSPANRVSVCYCGVCPGRSITRRLTPCTGSHGPLLESPPCPCTQRSGARDRGPRGSRDSLWFMYPRPRVSASPTLHSSLSREVGLFYSVLKERNRGSEKSFVSDHTAK